MKAAMLYRCPEVSCEHATLTEVANELRCPNGHCYPFIAQTTVPLFASIDENSNEYARQDAAQIHGNALRWVFETFKTNEADLRKSLIARLHLSKGQTILVTGVGAGNDLPYLAEALKNQGTIYAQDISRQMLLEGVNRHSRSAKLADVELRFSVSDATRLPFGDNAFDAAYHFGGINLFPDIRQGIFEMNRVVRPGGRLVISDEGLAPWLKSTELGKMLICNNPLYAYDAPLISLPETARSVQLSWEVSNCFYVIDFTKGAGPLDVNLDVPHVGKRGGTIRTRYQGQLEGIDPALKAKLYAEAEMQGISRVAYLESLLKGKRP